MTVVAIISQPTQFVCLKCSKVLYDVRHSVRPQTSMTFALVNMIHSWYYNYLSVVIFHVVDISLNNSAKNLLPFSVKCQWSQGVLGRADFDSLYFYLSKKVI